MRIGIDARLWDETGVGRYIRNLVWQLQEIDEKNEYVLFVSLGARGRGLGVRDDGFRIVETAIHWHSVEEQLKFPAVLEKENLDLVHFPYFSVPVFYRGPFVITIHDLIINHYPTGKASTLPMPLYYLKHFGYQFVMKEAARKARRILTVSNVTKKEIGDHLKVSDDKIVVTYEGVDKRLDSRSSSLRDEAQASESNDLRGNDKNVRYFLYVGNAYPHKNLERLLHAFKEVVVTNKGVKLFLVGKEDYFYKQLKVKVYELGLDNHIVFLGQVSDEELSNLYNDALGLITPSLMEGFGLPGLEAMQHGTLVLASDIPVYREVYKDAAVYFDPLDVSAMRVTILEVLDYEKKFIKHIEKGQILVKTFSWEKMAKETLAIYESSIGIRQSK